MPNLSIKNVPDQLLAQLRERAARHHRSIQGELMALLSAALASPSGTATTTGSTEAPARRSGTRRLEEIAAQHRIQWKAPIKKGPRAVDVIRADRDAR
jgi:plasmid stability protein